MIPLVITASLGLWAMYLRTRNAALEDRLRVAGAHAPADPTGAESTRGDPAGDPHRLARERRRLEWLRASLARVTAPGYIDADAILRGLARDIAAAEAELVAPTRVDGTHGPVGEEYHRQDLRRAGARQAEMLARRADLADRLTETKSADERARFTEQLGEVDDELARAGESPIAGSGPDDPGHARRRAERLDLERHVADLRADETYWSAQKAGAGAAGRQARVRTLERQIQEQDVYLRQAGH